MTIRVSRYTSQLIMVRHDGAEDWSNHTGFKEESAIRRTDLWKYNESEKAYTFPKQRILDLVAIAKADGLEIDYPEDLFNFEKESKKRFESTLAYLRLIRKTGLMPDDVDYFREGRYKGKFTPYKHQLVCFQWGMMMEELAILNEMGTGKTPVAIWVADERMNQKEVAFCLIVCPKNIMWNWEREIKLNAPHRKVVVLEGSRHRRLDLLETVSDFYIINYEGVRILGPSLKDRYQMIILDEAHKMKDPSADQTKAIQKYLSPARYKMIMTGTPLGNNLLDLHQPYIFLNKNIHEGYYTFRDRYFYQERYRWIPHSGTQDMIQDRIFQRSVRYLKTECLDLPEKVYITRTCIMSAEQKKVYDALTKQFIVEFEEGKIKASNVLAKIMRFSQITSGFVKNTEGTEVVFKDNAKLDLLMDVLDEIGDKKVVIWARFVRDIKTIAEKLGKRAISFYGGSTETPQQIVDKFNNDPDVNWLVGNPAVGGVGLNLTAADTMIYYSNDYSFIKRSQSEDRCHRIGSEKHDRITIIDLACQNSIDIPVIAALKKKKELSNVVIDCFEVGIIDAFSDITDGDDVGTKLAQILDSVTSTVEIRERFCPECTSRNIEKLISTDGQLWRCFDCRSEFTPAA